MTKKSIDTHKTQTLPLNHKKETNPSHLEPFLFRNIVDRNRYIFLRSLDQHYKLSGFKASLWQGTALHLLEMVHLISPEMHMAANEYLHISKKVLNEKSYFPLSRSGGRLSFNPTPFSQQIPNESQEKELEQKWRDLAAILINERAKSMVDQLGTRTDLSLLKPLLKTKPDLRKLQKGLGGLQTYLEDYKP